MKDLLIIFIVLLVLLLLISSFGGSLRYTDYVKPAEIQKIGQESNQRDENFTQDEDTNILFSNNINNVNNSNIGNRISNSIKEKKQTPMQNQQIQQIQQNKNDPREISPYDSSEVYGVL